MLDSWAILDPAPSAVVSQRMDAAGHHAPKVEGPKGAPQHRETIWLALALNF